MYRIDTTNIERILGILKTEYERSKMSRFQKVVFWLFQVSVYLIPASFIILLIVRFVAEDLFAYGKSDYLMFSPVLLMGLGIVSAIALLPFNLPMIRTVRRQLRLARELNLYLQDEEPSRIASVAMKVSFWLLVLITVIIGIIAYKTGSESGEWLGGFFSVFIVFVLPAMLLIGRRYLVRLRGGLSIIENVEGLRELLQKRQEEAEGAESRYVALPSGEAERLARFEKAFINQNRTEAIQSAMKSRSSGFTIFKSQAAGTYLEGLKPAMRFRVESTIQDLTLDPRPQGAAEDRRTGKWMVQVQDTPLTLIYTIDDELRQIRVDDVRA